MKSLWSKRTALPLLGAVVVLILGFAFWHNAQPWTPDGWTAPLSAPPAQAQTTGTDLTGWAWSSNIGWVSFNCIDPGVCSSVNYKVTMAADGKLSGHAWSNNIGWIQFNPTGSYPGVPLKSAQMSDGKLVGWARAQSSLLPGSNGWDGWIKMSDGTNYGVQLVDEGKLEGFAWGSEVVGWLKFGLDLDTGSNTCPSGVCVTISSGQSIACTVDNAMPSAGTTVTWTATPALAVTNPTYHWYMAGSEQSPHGNTFPQTVEAGTAYDTIQVSVTDSVTGITTPPQICPAVTLTQNRNVRVNVVYGSGVTSGSVSSEDGKFNTCSPSTPCSAQSYRVGNTIDFTATHDPGMSASWSGTGLTCSGDTCRVDVPSGSEDYVITVTISGAVAGCPAQIACVRANDATKSCINDPITFNTLNNNNLSGPLVRLTIKDESGALITNPTLAISFNFAEMTEHNDICTAPSTLVNGEHKVAQTSAGALAASPIANGTPYIVTGSTAAYQLQLPRTNNQYRCLPNGTYNITVTTTQHGCSQLPPFTIPVVYSSPDTSQAKQN